MKAIDVARQVLLAGASLRRRRHEGKPLVSPEAGLRVVQATTEVARRARAGPLPPARGLERVALSAARAQLRMMAGLLGLDVRQTASGPAFTPVEPLAVAGSEFVAPRDLTLVREARDAEIQAALTALVAEAIALVDDVLAAPAELGADPRPARALGRGDGHQGGR